MRQRLAVDDRRRRKPAAARTAERADQPLHRQLLQLVHLVALQPEPRHEGFGIPGRGPRGHTRDRCAALGHRPMEQPLGRRHAEQRAHLARAPRLAEDGDAARIAAEVRDVVADPLESRDDVAHAGVAGISVLFAAELGQVHEPERVQPVRDADDHDVVLAREVGAVIGHHPGRAGRIAAAVQPHHHRALAACANAGRPDVQVETVFAHRLAQVERFPFLDEDRIDERRPMPELEGVEDTRPRLRLERRKKTTRAGGRRAVRHAFERLDFVLGDQAADLAGRRRDRRARRGFCPLRQRPH